MARWNIEACLEIVRRCEDLYLLIDKKIQRTVQVIEKLETASVSAVEAVERLEVLKGMLGKEVEKLSKAKQTNQKANALAREQREQRIMRSIDTSALSRRRGLETPTKSFRGVGMKNQISVTNIKYPEMERVRCLGKERMRSALANVFIAGFDNN